jgi:hypothetical protein
MHGRRRRGSTLLETVAGASFALVVLGAGIQLTKSGTDLARSAAAGDTAGRRAEHALAVFADAVRTGSTAEFRRVDGSTFADGASDDGIQGRRVVGFSGNPILGTTFTLRWQAAGTSGEVVRTQDGITEIVARGVDRFRVSRAGDAFTVNVTTSVQVQGSNQRTSRGSVTARSRNP